jgi:hypothetical protein
LFSFISRNALLNYKIASFLFLLTFIRKKTKLFKVSILLPLSSKKKHPITTNTTTCWLLLLIPIVLPLGGCVAFNYCAIYLNLISKQSCTVLLCKIVTTNTTSTIISRCCHCRCRCRCRCHCRSRCRCYCRC